AVRLPGGRLAKPATKVATDSVPAKPATRVATDPDGAQPNRDELLPDGPEPGPSHTPAEDQNPPLSEKSVSAANDSDRPEPRSCAISACEPYREAIELGLSRGRNAMAIWQDLVSQHGFAHQYGSVKRWVRKQRGQQTPLAIPIIVTAPGEEAQVDYGTGPLVRDPQSGKYRRTRLFVMTLGYSRKSVRLLVFRSSSRTWAELHEQAFRRLGGVVRTVVLDNLREGVLVPDVYDPTLNPLYRDVLAHYGAVAVPCRVRHPDRKGKVESGVGHAQKTPLKGLRFETLEQAQAHLDGWERQWADTRTGKQAGAFNVFMKEKIEMAQGDQLLLQANLKQRGLEVTNGDVALVKQVDEKGRIHLQDGRVLPAWYRQFKHGYAMTAHRSQGKTADAVIVSADQMSGDLFYVAASRGREQVQIFTSDLALLR